jgi:hypothetical protein
MEIALLLWPLFLMLLIGLGTIVTERIASWLSGLRWWRGS